MRNIMMAEFFVVRNLRKNNGRSHRDELCIMSISSARICLPSEKKNIN